MQKTIAGGLPPFKEPAGISGVTLGPKAISKCTEEYL
jgi:hypothetical protein